MRWSRCLRGRLEGVGPVTVEALVESSGLSKLEIETGLLGLEGEGFVIRGRFTPGITETEWCARRLLARIHSYTLNRLRQEIEPVASTDFIRFLLAWQKVAPEHQMEGPESVRAIIDQLEGFEAPAAAWEGELLPAAPRRIRSRVARCVVFVRRGCLGQAKSPSIVAAYSKRWRAIARRWRPGAKHSHRSLASQKLCALERSLSPLVAQTHSSEFSTTTQLVYDYLQLARRFVLHRHRREHRAAAQPGRRSTCGTGSQRRGRFRQLLWLARAVDAGQPQDASSRATQTPATGLRHGLRRTLVHPQARGSLFRGDPFFETVRHAVGGRSRVGFAQALRRCVQTIAGARRNGNSVACSVARVSPARSAW